MRGRKGDKQPGHTQKVTGKQRGRAARQKAKQHPALNRRDTCSKGSPQEMSGGMSE